MTNMLIAANLLLFVAMVVTTGFQSLTSPTSDTLLDWGANFRPLTMGGEYWRLLTSVFLHIGFTHLAMNMAGLFVVGQMAENLYGRTKFLVIYLLAGVGGSLYSAAFNPEIVSAGASGAIFGMFGCWLAFFLAYRNRLAENYVKANIKVIGFILVYNLGAGMLIPGLDTAAHIGGFLTGLISGLLLVPGTPGESHWRVRDVVSSLVMCGLLLGVTVGLNQYIFHHSVSGMGMDELKPLGRGMALLRQDRSKEARAEFDKVIAANPKNAYAYVLRSQALYQEKRYQEALIDANSAIEVNPKLPDGYIWQAHALRDLERYPEALSAVNRALSLNPESSDAHLARSLIYDRAGDSAKALQDSESAIRLAPNQVAPYVNRGYARISLGLIDDARKDFDTALNMSRDKPQAMWGKIMCEFLKDDFEKCAISSVFLAQKLDYKPEPAPYAVILGALSYKANNHTQQYLDLLHTAMIKKPKNEWPSAVFRYLAGQLSAKQLLSEAKDNDQLTEAQAYIGLDLLVQKKTKEAIPYLKWVKEHGNEAFNEYDLAVQELSKLSK